MAHKTKKTLTWAKLSKLKVANAKRAREMEEAEGEKRGDRKDKKGKVERKKNGKKMKNEGPIGDWEVPVNYGTPHPVPPLPEAGLRDSGGKTGKFKISGNGCQGLTRSRRSVSCWPAGAGQFMCHPSQMNYSAAKRHPTRKTHQGDI